ncbi:hypothetical protein C7S18_00085 [Ahniella affigens]|uniref:Uncharacterized protein n=1 Tax=Ahniella affigens TaxID=2021234 RepID=A0A2P1PLH8_9GAMM|nr:hypothetical protein [Ahniella affigens]AVP95689.1 hypothetical protein C7S18_00085 [Ahniella affigens]
MRIKYIALFAAATLWAQASWCAESAGLVGIMNTSGTVDVNNFTNPRSILTLYRVNDPSSEAVVLAYVAFRHLGEHQASIEFADASGQPIDRCNFEPMTVTKLPWVQTITCQWGGRLPDGGINVTVFNRFRGKKEKVGEMFIPAKE